MTVTAINVNEIGLVQPKSAPRVITTFKATMTRIKTIKPGTSNFDELPRFVLLSGTSFIKNIDNKVIIIEKTKI